MKSIENMTRAEKIAACARAAYEANRTFCIAIAEEVIPPPWEDAKPVWLSGISNTVEAVLIGDGPSSLHKKWLDVMSLAGWKYGVVKDSAKKESPKLASYNDLPGTAKRQYQLTVDIVRAMAKALDLKVQTVR